MQLNEILQISVSHQQTIWLPTSKTLTIKEVLEEMSSNTFKDKIGYLRMLYAKGDMDNYNMHKRALPAVTFCGVFNEYRKKENLRRYNNLMVIDIDKLDTTGFEKTKKALQGDPYVFSFWASPSNKGFKGLIALDYQFSIEDREIEQVHKSAFACIADYFMETHQIALDESGCDITRLCFLSYDPALVLKASLQPFAIQKKVYKQQRGWHEGREFEFEKRLLQHKNDPEERRLVERIIRFLETEKKSITSTYEQWFRVAYGLAEAFTFKVGLDYYLSLCAMDGVAYHESASRNMFYYCYKNSSGKIKLNTILYYAVGKGYQDAAPNIKPSKNDHGNKDKL